MKKIILKLITIYQKTISPDHGVLNNSFNGCRYYPSCSAYAKESIEKKGVIRGVLNSSWRVIRCNPLSKGGINKP